MSYYGFIYIYNINEWAYQLAENALISSQFKLVNHYRLYKFDPDRSLFSNSYIFITLTGIK